MNPILSTVLNWITGGLADKLLDAYKAKLSADSDVNNAIADERLAIIRADVESQRNARAIRLATAGFLEMRILTVVFAAPFALHVAMVGLDTCFRLGWHVAKFPAPFDEWEGAIVLSFFGVTVVGAGLKALAGAIAFRK